MLQRLNFYAEYFFGDLFHGLTPALSRGEGVVFASYFNPFNLKL
jgi:hypothetical protein